MFHLFTCFMWLVNNLIKIIFLFSFLLLTLKWLKTFAPNSQNICKRICAIRPAETEASPYAGYQLAYEVKKLMYDKTFFLVIWCSLFLRNFLWCSFICTFVSLCIINQQSLFDIATFLCIGQCLVRLLESDCHSLPNFFFFNFLSIILWLQIFLMRFFTF